MEEWKTYRLGDVINVLDYKRVPLSSKERESRKGVYPYYGAQGIIDYINDYIFDGEYLLIAEDGENLKSQKQNIAQIARGKFWVNNHAHIVESNGKSDIRFICYLLNRMDLSGYITGSAQPKLNQANLLAMEVCLPDLATQIRIVGLLSSFDDKIAINNRINHNLEEQAKALYKSWFVDFEPFKDGKFEGSELGMIPFGWNVKKIGELPLFIADYVANGSFASLKENVRLYESENYAVFIRNTDLKSGSFPIFVDAHSYNFLSKTKLTGGEIIISNVGDVGSVHFCPRLNRPMTLGNNVVMIKAEERHYYAFLYLCFKYFSGHYSIEGITGGSAMPKFNKTDFKGIQLIIPSSDILSRFDEIASSLFHRIEVNKRECEELSSQRDTLLPALMSGQITC